MSFTFNLSTIESIADNVDNTVDRWAPMIAPLAPEVAAAIPIVDGIRKLIDDGVEWINSFHAANAPTTTTASALTSLSASKVQLENAVAAAPAS